MDISAQNIIASAPVRKSNALQIQQAPSSGGLQFARKQDTGNKAMGSKKLDFDFGSDDFFNSFQPAAAAIPNTNELVEISDKQAAAAIVNDPFEMASSVKPAGHYGSS